MYLGRIVESGPVQQIFDAPRHPYTMALLQSLPSRNLRSKRLPSIPGSVPPLSRTPVGCPFHPRCAYAVRGVCDVGGAPSLLSLDGDDAHQVACVRATEIATAAHA
jgi:oligopeptide/dipeptide ABC transporter ATP-binding protein